MRRIVLVLLLLVLGGSSPASAEPGGPSAAEPPAATPLTAAPPAALWTSPLGDPPLVTRPFAPPANPYGPGHRGADLAGEPGAPVLAAGGGVVAFAGMVAGRPVVSVDHPGGLRTTYEPVAPSVGAGARVEGGTLLGVLAPGHAGCPVAACLHWGLRRGETYLDPLALLRPPRIRLLPWGGRRARGPFPSPSGRALRRRRTTRAARAAGGRSPPAAEGGAVS